MWFILFTSFLISLIRVDAQFLPLDKCDGSIGWNSSQAEILAYLTAPCRYNIQKPPPQRPVQVFARVFVYFLKATTGSDLKFQAQILLQLKWEDERLQFSNYKTRLDVLLGEKYLMESIWMPHVYLSNERDSLVMGFLRKDDFIVLHSSGVVRFTTRLKAKVSCHMELGKFPFDVQKCSLVMDSWRYNSSEVSLEWEQPHPVQLQGGKISLTEFSLVTMTTEEKIHQYHSSTDFNKYNYSSLVLAFTLAREYGFYVMDYYIPSVLLVILSWVSFWLTPDALPARINLGSSTMLTFLLLGWGSGSVPKVSQFQSNNIWAIGCTLFIFLSLVEFAFVNTIDRSGSDKVPVKKPTSKYIIKSSLNVPTKPRKKLRRTSSCPSSPELRRHFGNQIDKPKHRKLQELSQSDLSLRLHSLTEETSSKSDEDRSGVLTPRRPPPKSVRIEMEEVKDQLRRDSVQLNLSNPALAALQAKAARAKRRQSIIPGAEVFSMTPQEIAKWIDEKSRIVFPTSFFFFCLFYWSFLWL